MSSSSSLEKEIDEYQDDSSRNESSEGSTSCNDSSDEHYSSGYLVFLWRNFRNYNVGWLLDLGLAHPDSHLALLKTRKRMRKTSFIVVPQR